MAGDRVRDEAERFIAAAITAVSLAARGMGAAGRGSGFATGSPECCVCPVCRAIAAMRDPSADVAERLASGAGDLATGLTSMLRALARGSGHAQEAEGERTREGDEFWESLRRRAAAEATAWRTSSTATSTDEFGESEEDTADPWRVATTAAPAAPKPMAKKVAKKAVKKAEQPVPPAARRPEPDPGPESGSPAPTTPTGAAKKVAKKAASTTVEPPGRGAPAKKATKKATRATSATKAAKKAPPPQEFG
jgi:hypothetical protein